MKKILKILCLISSVLIMSLCLGGCLFNSNTGSNNQPDNNDDWQEITTGPDSLNFTISKVTLTENGVFRKTYEYKIYLKIYSYQSSFYVQSSNISLGFKLNGVDYTFSKTPKFNNDSSSVYVEKNNTTSTVLSMVIGSDDYNRFKNSIIVVRYKSEVVCSAQMN